MGIYVYVCVNFAHGLFDMRQDVVDNYGLIFSKELDVE